MDNKFPFIHLGLNQAIRKIYYRIVEFLILCQNHLKLWLIWRPKYLFEKFIAFQKFPQLRVNAGEFKNLKYPYYPKVNEHFSVFLPKLVGSYESELNSVVLRIINTKYSRIINIGSDDGYYALGMAYRKSDTLIFAIDINPTALDFSIRAAQLNNLSNFVAVMLADSLAYAQLFDSRSCVICDCEGLERELINIKNIPQLREVDVLVEIHGDDIGEQMVSQFNSTHKITKITQNTEKVQLLNIKLGWLNFNYHVSEMRSSTVYWLFLESNQNYRVEK